MVEIAFDFYSKSFNKYLTGYFDNCPYEYLTIFEIKEIIKCNKMNFYRRCLYKRYDKESTEYKERFKIPEKDIRVIYRIIFNSLNLEGEID